MNFRFSISDLRLARAARSLLVIFITSSILILAAAGCAALGVMAHAVPQFEKPVYVGLAGQSVGVMVWADRGVKIDWPGVQVMLATLVQDKLAKSGAEEVKGSTYPVLAESIVRYQRDHPGIEAVPITETAPKLGVSRLIYIEIESLSTRSDTSLQMYRGNVAAALKVVEVAPDHTAKVAYEEGNIHTFYPPKSTQEGVLNSNDMVMFNGTVAALSEEIVNRLITHQVDK